MGILTTARLLLLSSWLWPLTVLAQDKTAADYHVSSLPGAPEPLLKMYAGHIEVSHEHHGNLFFWLFKNRHIANKQRTVIWINGGPGCSSMDGALMEIGPYRVNKDGTLRLNDGSWDEFANILFIDNPVGTGFSYVDGDSYVSELDQMASQMVDFLEAWFRIFPEYSKDDLYIAGESYAGQHIPYIAKAILDRNAASNANDVWNLSGLLIGNGWLSGPEQYISYIPLMYEVGLMKSGSKADKAARAQESECLKQLAADNDQSVDISACDNIMRVILKQTVDGRQCINMYDTRLRDDYPSCGMAWPPDLETVTPWLRKPEVTSALNINSDKRTGWVECSGQVSSHFTARNSKPSKVLLPELLEKIPIVLFSGDQDLICNHIGTENVISNLEWSGGKGMETSPGMTAPIRHWTVDSEPAGTWQTARNLTYVRFYNSSHMVPFDYPRRTRDMLDRFLKVDLGSIGGEPIDSRIDGEPGQLTSVGGHPNSTAAKAAEEDKLQAATWTAYRRSAEAALVVVIIAASAWAFFIWRGRRRAGYTNVLRSDPYDGGMGGSGLGLDSVSLRSRQSKEERDIEAAADFDEAELDDLSHLNGRNGHYKDMQRDRFTLGDEEEDDDDDHAGHKRG